MYVYKDYFSLTNTFNFPNVPVLDGERFIDKTLKTIFYVKNGGLT